MVASCKKPDCTVAQTGICLLNNNADTCPERLLAEVDPDASDLSELTVPPPLSAPPRNPQFPSSLTLTPDALKEACGGRFFRLIGILGAPDAGKTAILVSLYLLLSRDSLEGFKYADSLSLLAFDEVSRGARRWNQGKPPEQMTNHTEPPDHRTAGFLHLRLRDRKSETTDILLPDLPGEWSTSFVDSNRVDRLGFLKAADVIWLMIDGRQLIELPSRQQVLHRSSLLLQRISEFLGSNAPPVFIVISHRDLGNPSNASIQKLHAEAQRFGVPVKIVQVSSFSDNDLVAPGTGIAELVESSLAGASASSVEAFWPDSEAGTSKRHLLKFRIGRMTS
jgi:hypothetical protein